MMYKMIVMGHKINIKIVLLLFFDGVDGKKNKEMIINTLQPVKTPSKLRQNIEKLTDEQKSSQRITRVLTELSSMIFKYLKQCSVKTKKRVFMFDGVLTGCNTLIYNLLRVIPSKL